MTIRLFSKPGLQGSLLTIREDSARLNGTTSSLELTGNRDRALFFTGHDYQGRVMFRTGQQQIERIGSKKKGGKYGFGNNLGSVRVSPLPVSINIAVFRDSNGDYPGEITSEEAFLDYLDNIVSVANSIWAQAMIQIHVQDIRFIVRDRYFNIAGRGRELHFRPRFTAEDDWPQKYDRLNFFIVNNFLRSDNFGYADLPGSGRNALVRAIGLNAGAPASWTRDSIDMTGNTFAHELGHLLGLRHRTGGDNARNLMNISGTQALVNAGNNYGRTRTQLTTAQIEKAQRVLASSRLKMRHA